MSFLCTAKLHVLTFYLVFLNQVCKWDQTTAFFCLHSPGYDTTSGSGLSNKWNEMLVSLCSTTVSTTWEWSVPPVSVGISPQRAGFHVQDVNFCCILCSRIQFTLLVEGWQKRTLNTDLTGSDSTVAPSASAFWLVPTTKERRSFSDGFLKNTHISDHL